MYRTASPISTCMPIYSYMYISHVVTSCKLFFDRSQVFTCPNLYRCRSSIAQRESSLRFRVERTSATRRTMTWTCIWPHYTYLMYPVPLHHVTSMACFFVSAVHSGPVVVPVSVAACGCSVHAVQRGAVWMRVCRWVHVIGCLTVCLTAELRLRCPVYQFLKIFSAHPNIRVFMMALCCSYLR